MKVNKKAVLSTAAVLGVSALAIGGTIAYFTDHETVENHFTVGNVDVTLYESQLHRVNSNVAPQYQEGNSSPVSLDNYHLCANGNVYCTPNLAVSTDLSGVSAWQNGHVRAQNVAGVSGAGQTGVYSDQTIINDSESDAVATSTNPGGYTAYATGEYEKLVPGKQVKKFVYVKNTGENPAYVRVRVTIDKEVADIVTVKAPHTPQEECAKTKVNNVETCIEGAANTNKDGVDFSNHKYVTQLADSTDASGNKVMTFVFTDALKKNEMTYWSPITTVKINDNVKESDFTGERAAVLQNGFGVTVDVDAIQSEGFANAATAFEAYE